MSSDGTLVVSEVDSAAKSQKQGMRRRRAQQSPFKVPDNNSIFLLGAHERRERKEEMRKFLALPIEEKTTHAARMMANLKNEVVGELGEEEENERKKKAKQIKSNMVLPKQTSDRHELKIAMMKEDKRRRDNITEESKHNLIFMARQQAVLELSLMTKREEILRMDKVLAKEEKKLKELEKIMERDNHKFEEFLRENERKSVEARTLFEQEDKSKQEKTAEIRKLTAEIGAIKSEMIKFEDVLVDYKRYQKFLFKISPPEWQEEQKKKALKAEVLPDGDRQDDQGNEAEDAKKGLESKLSSSSGDLSSIRDTRPPSARSDTRGINSKVEGDGSEFEDEPELYFTHPQQLLDLMAELTEQNLSLIQNSARVEEALEKLRQLVEKTRTKIQKDEEQLEHQTDYMNQKIDKEKKRSAKLELKIQLHVSLSTEDQDVMLDALSEKVAEVHRSCVDDRMTNLSTLEKVANIENCMISLLQGLESIPEEKLAMMMKIKESEKRTRQREEKLREQREKQQERMRRYMERSLADSKKISGRKLMPRCMPVAQKVKVITVDDSPTEDEINEYLFGTEDTE
ncbi:cilia- and flagella-associated protein 100-like [Melanotaenia boesemani]|uniref:cilia- and flagella-associated protein 100-like n=1 Tax=Melanotaenia boesemani TaxID=1250792 RepID=UPI001C04AF19|nr:cilia- and flagella-associated protein 100-like [Melanotaenia boesemani]